MAKDKKASRELKNEAAKIIRAVNIQGESRSETQRLQAGVQRAIEYYLRQHSAKARELDKKTKKLHRLESVSDSAPELTTAPPNTVTTRLPWLLLMLSWALFIGYLLLEFLVLDFV